MSSTITGPCTCFAAMRHFSFEISSTSPWQSDEFVSSTCMQSLCEPYRALHCASSLAVHGMRCVMNQSILSEPSQLTVRVSCKRDAVAHLELWQVQVLHLHLERQLVARRQDGRDLDEWHHSMITLRARRSQPVLPRTFALSDANTVPN